MYYTELYLRSRVPICTRVCYYPIDEVATASTTGLTLFEEIISPKKVTHPFIDTHTVFALNDSSDMEDIITQLNQTLCDHATRSDA